jgi:predicted amidohydrolase
MSTHLNVALLQLAAEGRDRKVNLQRGVRACRDAKAADAHVALFPEMWTIGYDLRQGEPPEELARHAIDLDDAFLGAFADLAAQLDMAIAITFLQRWPQRPRNAVAVFDRRGHLSFTYAKVHTCDWDTEAVLTPGDRFEVAEVETPAGRVRLGAMICFDLLFPEAARVLMLQGAEIVLMPNSCDFEPWRTAVVQARAIENMFGIAVANYPGEGSEGHSCAFDPIAFRTLGGKEGVPVDPTVVRAGKAPGIHMARFALDELRRFRAAETQGDAYRKPSTYGPIVEAEVQPPFVRSDARR